MELKLNDQDVPDGTVLKITVVFENSRGVRTSPKEYGYVFLKAGGYWYGSGTGDVPQGAGWGAVRRWLTDRNRRPIRVEVLTGSRVLWSDPGIAT